MSDKDIPNRLIHEKSPYLLQHAYNPVDWFPWGDEAFEKARREQKPIFLSVGYSTCYWCHVMEREVFENPALASLMNQKLVNIKVDREERPDIDRIYMTILQAMSGSGGWPMSVFLTPGRAPIFAATYIPPEPRHGRPGFAELVNRIVGVWEQDRDRVLRAGEEIIEFLRQPSGAAGAPEAASLDAAFESYRRNYDHTFGGFGPGPKFPRPSVFNFLFRYYAYRTSTEARDMSLATLRAMASGGMYDHLGGGFHRYSVDAQWRVPHFEKMLYDQAQLIISNLEAWQISREPLFECIARETLDYVLGTLRDPNGGFYSAEDAESAVDASSPSDKEEGRSYLWTKAEIDQILGADARLFNARYGIEESGNALHDPMGVFHNLNILYHAKSIDQLIIELGFPAVTINHILEDCRKKLLAVRALRPRPHLDDKILTAWNGLMISATARAAVILGDARYLRHAKEAASFILATLVDGNGNLLRRFRDGDARFDAGLQDYAFLVQGLLDLFEASTEPSWLDRAMALMRRQIELFHDPASGGFFDTTGADDTLLLRMREEYDGAEPSGNSVSALNLLRLSHLTGKQEWRDRAESTIRSFGRQLHLSPEAIPQMLVALHSLLTPPVEIIVTGRKGSPDTEEMLAHTRTHFLSNGFSLFIDCGETSRGPGDLLPATRGMKMLGAKATAYVCEDFACQLPITDPEALAVALDRKQR